MDIASCNSGGNQTAVYSANKIQDNTIPVETSIQTPSTLISLVKGMLWILIGSAS